LHDLLRLLPLRGSLFSDSVAGKEGLEPPAFRFGDGCSTS
jgi:hypothetical protein